ncbi:MAG: Glu-tRNA(Gln) amidotransferase subunit GatD [archaeon]
MNLHELMKKFSVKEMDEVKVYTLDEEFTGVVMHSRGNKIFVLKLKNGYNIGIHATRVTKIEKLGEEGKEERKIEAKKVEHKPDLPSITILHSGGTIASRIDYRTGAVSASVKQEEIVEHVPELEKIANIKSKSILDMLSGNMRFYHFKKIAKAIEEEAKEGVKGIILGHGTDTMHYSSAALSFMLEGINIPVIMVGSQRSSDRGSSDSAMNLVCAAEFITKTDFSGVGICMHEGPSDDNCVILPGTKTRKMHSSRRDAFKAINDIPIARINYETRKIEFLKKDYPKRDEGREFKLKDKIEEKVGLLKIHPDMKPEEIEFFEEKGYKGLVLEGTGLGNAPVVAKEEGTEINAKILEAIRKLVDKGCVVVMTSQTIYGRVQMNVYSYGKDCLEAGVIPGEDMTPETAFIKLAWLLGNYSKEEAKELVGKNLRGEITPCSTIKGFDVEFK